MSELKACPNMLCGSENVGVSVGSHSIIECFDCRIDAHIDDWQNRPAENRIKAQGIREALDECESYLTRNASYTLSDFANKLEGEE